jgi:uncharacterized protein YtpQ (UPF0354 family)
VNPPNQNLLQHFNRPELTREAFFLLYVRLIEDRFPGTQVEFTSQDSLQVKSDTGKKIEVFLSNLWIEFSGRREEGPEIVERYLKMMMRPEGFEPEGTIKDIIPIVKDRAYVELLKENIPDVAEHFAGDLWIVYAFDLPESIDSLTQAALDRLNTNKEKMRLVALDNLRRILPDIERHGDGPWYLLTAGPIYAASLLLLDEIWEELKVLVEGDVVAVVPSRDVLMFTGSRSSEGILQIRERIDQIFATGSYLVSRTLLRRVEGSWIVL